MVAESSNLSSSSGLVEETASFGICQKPTRELIIDKLRITIWDPLHIQNIFSLKPSSSFITKKMMRITMPPTKTRRPRNKPFDADLQSTWNEQLCYARK